MKIKKDIYCSILNFFNDTSCEQGGILGVDENDIICAFYGDKSGKGTEGTYEPDVDTLNGVILKWYKDNIYFIGLIHNHLGGCPRLSKQDKFYALNIFKVMDSDKIIFPLVIRKNNDIRIYNFIYINKLWMSDSFEVID